MVKNKRAIAYAITTIIIANINTINKFTTFCNWEKNDINRKSDNISQLRDVKLITNDEKNSQNNPSNYNSPDNRL